MKRDMDLVRRILLEIETKPFTAEIIRVEIPEYSEDDISYHLRIMGQAGLVDVRDFSSDQRFDVRAIGLTWAGHELLDASRDEGRWQQAVEVVKTKGGGLVFDILKEVLVNLVRTSVLGA